MDLEAGFVMVIIFNSFDLANIKKDADATPGPGSYEQDRSLDNIKPYESALVGKLNTKA